MKINPKVYRDAAKRVNKPHDEYGEYTNKYCCNNLSYDDRELFETYFKPEVLPRTASLYGWWGKHCEKTEEQRILALLFMELIVEDLNNE